MRHLPMTFRQRIEIAVLPLDPHRQGKHQFMQVVPEFIDIAGNADRTGPMAREIFQVRRQPAHLREIGGGRARHIGIARVHQAGVELDIFMSEVNAQDAEKPVELHQDRNGGGLRLVIVGEVDEPIRHRQRGIMLLAQYFGIDHGPPLRPRRLPFAWPFLRSGRN
jgi:hypothetical protein